ncbi:MAG TPA: hypothetical protein VGI99_11620 [Gemmataceae bacterium]|jgi:hypothetical protein
MKWDFFIQKLRPLATEQASRVCKALFAGVVHPFHYQKARGWMRDIFRNVRSSPDWTAKGLSSDAALANAFGPGDPGIAFVVCDAIDSVYAAPWADLLDVFRRGWLMAAIDTFVLCAEGSHAVALHWENAGLYFGKRGDRRLLDRLDSKT